jgi:hypothetical protein
MLAGWAVAGALLFGCVSAPSGAQKAPDWVSKAPKADAKYTYFTAESTDPTGDRGKATDVATDKIIQTVIGFLGVKITAEFEGETKASLDSYAVQMKQTVTSESKARFVGFTIDDKYYLQKDKKTKAVTAYVLAKYETAEMEKERKRLQDLIDEQNNLILVPERDGKAALAESRAIDAVQLFLQAAAGAASVDIENKEIKLQRNLNNALNALAPLRVIRVSAPSQVGLNQELTEPFVAKVVMGEDDKGPGAPGAKLSVSYQRKQASGRLANKSEGKVSDAKGLVSFTPPAYDYVGASKVTMSLDAGALTELLDRIPQGYESLTDAIRREIGGKYVDFEIKIGSDAKATPLHIAIVDLDEAGAASGNAAQRAVLDGLVKEKFKAQALAASADAVKAGDAAALLAAAKGVSAVRLVYGTASIQSVKKDSGSYVAACKIVLSVLDVAAGGEIASSEKSATSIGSTEAEARSNAWRDAGKAAVKDLMAKLP